MMTTGLRQRKEGQDYSDVAGLWQRKDRSIVTLMSRYSGTRHVGPEDDRIMTKKERTGL